jgi:hypothetical protein
LSEEKNNITEENAEELTLTEEAAEAPQDTVSEADTAADTGKDPEQLKSEAEREAEYDKELERLLRIDNDSDQEVLEPNLPLHPKEGEGPSAMFNVYEYFGEVYMRDIVKDRRTQIILTLNVLGFVLMAIGFLQGGMKNGHEYFLGYPAMISYVSIPICFIGFLYSYGRLHRDGAIPNWANNLKLIAVACCTTCIFLYLLIIAPHIGDFHEILNTFCKAPELYNHLLAPLLITLGFIGYEDGFDMHLSHAIIGGITASGLFALSIVFNIMGIIDTGYFFVQGEGALPGVVYIAAVIAFAFISPIISRKIVVAKTDKRVEEDFADLDFGLDEQEKNSPADDGKAE